MTEIFGGGVHLELHNFILFRKTGLIFLMKKYFLFIFGVKYEIDILHFI